ncbi:apolipoprotein N-acyltransferase [Acinetobacter sp. ANC 3791]|uniref:apolipoprotein N-acyltransferase n=1 Tax=Acinetobacter sp. ANC 3791 TaxID=2529836 RepID=UPI00103CDAFE|nr:apolipoprotein N-acyltransferase [Acinetobacter sp. ANC 3791]TCB84509.1 apolipoprotein N-acyltransferase [Acinetobacter sp. ANC 3791]
MSQIFIAKSSKNNSTAKLPLWLGSLIALLAGSAFIFALAPYYIWIVALISPAVLYACLQQRSAPQALLVGWCYGFGLWFVGAFWLYTSIHEYGDTSAFVSVLLIAIMASIMALFSALQAWVYRRFFPETPLTFAPLWVFFEWAKTWVFTGFPWLFVGYAFTERFLDQYAPLFGVFGISFIAVTIACGLVEIIRRKWFWVVPIVVLLAGAWAASFAVFVYPKAGKPLQVSLIQGNIPQDLKWLTSYQNRTLEIYHDLSAPEWGRDLVVWPESSIPMPQNSIEPFLQDINHQALAKHSAWVTGIPYFDEAGSIKAQKPLFYNAMMASGEQTSGLYQKQRLVPFGEYVPLAGLLKWVLPSLQNDASAGGFTAGQSGQKPLSVKGHNLGAVICYEVAYPNLTRLNAEHSDFMVTVSNDAWFTGTAGPWQHLQMVQMRAKENGRWFIRATNTGVTAFIDAQGHIVKQAPQDKTFVLRGDLPAYTGQTLYNRLGNAPVLIFSALLLLLSLRYRPRQIDVSFKSRR